MLIIAEFDARFHSRLRVTYLCALACDGWNTWRRFYLFVYRFFSSPFLLRVFTIVEKKTSSFLIRLVLILIAIVFS